MTASITVVSCLYGSGYGRFVGEWDHAIQHLNPRPDSVIVTADRHYEIPHAHVFVIPDCDWRHPQAFYLQNAVELAQTTWVWVVDIDDQALPDGLDGLEDVQADSWQVGYLHSDDDTTYLPPQLTAAEYLAQSGNPFPAGSMFRTDAFHAAGGFPDAAFQDWGLWRRMALSGATFESSTRAHYRYMRHPGTRSTVELLPERRVQNIAEMVESESVAVA